MLWSGHSCLLLLTSVSFLPFQCPWSEGRREGRDFLSCRISPPKRTGFSRWGQQMKPIPQPCHPERSEGPRIRLLLRYRVPAFSRYSRGIVRMPRIFFVSPGGQRGPSLRPG